MKSGDHIQDPLPGENDDETAGPDRRKGGASHKPIARFTPQSDEPPERDVDDPYPPKVGPPPPPA